MILQFTKMHGIGNDFVMLDNLNGQLNELPMVDLARRWCDRNFGIGADGLIIADKGDTVAFRMRMLNPDGSESEMCGNGVRCFHRYLIDQGLTSETDLPVETGAGLLHLKSLPEEMVQVDMGKAMLLTEEIGLAGLAPGTQFIGQDIGEGRKGTAVSMGNPHLVIFVDDVDAIDLAVVGPELEKLRLFPNRTNVHFAQILSNSEIKQRTWERGAGITLACGTGACAGAVASFLNGHCGRSVRVHLPGGVLDIQYKEDSTVMMTGEAKVSFKGQTSI